MNEIFPSLDVEENGFLRAGTAAQYIRPDTPQPRRRIRLRPAPLAEVCPRRRPASSGRHQDLENRTKAYAGPSRERPGRAPHRLNEASRSRRPALPEPALYQEAGRRSEERRVGK